MMGFTWYRMTELLEQELAEEWSVLIFWIALRLACFPAYKADLFGRNRRAG